MIDWTKALCGVFAVIIEESGSYTYIAEAKEDTASAASPVWRVRRVSVTTDSSGNARTVVAWAGGVCGFVHSADDMASLSYADY